MGGAPTSLSEASGLIASVDDVIIAGGLVLVGCATNPACGDAIGDQAKAAASVDRLKQCLQMREAFSKKWFNDQDPGHLTEITNTQQGIRKPEEFLRNSCPAEYCS